MHYSQIIKADLVNGEGIRISLFVSGCTNRCKGCFQPETWDFRFGSEYTKDTEEEIMQTLKRPMYDGLSILGGEPMEPDNQKVISELIRRVRKELPEKTIWVYTGFVYGKDLLEGQRKHTEYTDEILNSIDVLVDGPFVDAKKNGKLMFRGSENQRIIDMDKTRKTGNVVLSNLM